MLWKVRPDMAEIVASNRGAVIIAAVLMVFLLAVLFVYKESTGFRVVRYSFVNNKLKKPSFRFVMISDMHDCIYGERNCEVLEAIDKEQPEAILLAGDMVTSYMEPEYHDSNAVRFIEDLAGKYPVYYGIGNHEDKLRRCPDEFPGKFKELTDELARIGIHMLLDEKVSIDEAGIDIYGLDMEHEYYRKLKTNWIPDGYLEGKLGTNDRSRISILLAHNPEHFDRYAGWEPDYVLSGHVHGGIINIPLLGGVISPQLKLFPKYDAGVFHKDKSTMILSRGLGSHTVPIRVFNKAEVVVVDLYRDEADRGRLQRSV